MGLTDTVAAAAFAAVRTNLDAAQVTVRFGGATATGLMVDVSEAKRSSMYGADPNYGGRVWALSSEITGTIQSRDTVEVDSGAGYVTYRARQVDELAGITRIELESEFKGE